MLACRGGGGGGRRGNVGPKAKENTLGRLRWRRPESLRHPFDGELSVGDVHDRHAGDLAYPPLELLVARGNDVAPMLLSSLSL